MKGNIPHILHDLEKHQQKMQLSNGCHYETEGKHECFPVLNSGKTIYIGAFVNVFSDKRL